MSKIVESGILVVLFFLVIDVVFLNIYLISRNTNTTAAATVIKTIPTESSTPCDNACQENISSKVLEKITPVVLPTSDEVKNTNQHEYIVQLGDGSSSSKEYETIVGTDFSLDTALYPDIAEVYFETTMSIPTANGFAYTKLFNVTDKHDVWSSEESMETNTPTFRQTKIHLDNGKKVYRVMMKSTMGFEAKLYNARLRIITNSL